MTGRIRCLAMETNAIVIAFHINIFHVECTNDSYVDLFAVSVIT